MAKLPPGDPTTEEVFECCINGQEISPGYTEQNDPIQQRATLEHQAGGEQQKLGDDFLTALEHGMPPAGGIRIGIDRLCMILLGQESIRDVILFPQLKPKENQSMALGPTCPICRSPAKVQDRGGGTNVDCQRCGRFKLSDFASLEVSKLSWEEIAKISGWIHEHPNCEISPEQLHAMAALKMPTVGEKAEKLMLFLAREFPKPGETLPLYPTSQIWSKLPAIAWARDEGEIEFLLSNFLRGEKQYLTPSNESQRITPKGWAYIDSLRNANPNSAIGFIAMWFDTSVNPVCEAIHTAIDQAKYKPLRIDRHQHNNRIDDEIMATIRRSKFVVADLTGQRGGVYFEAGFALGLGLTVIWLCRKDELPNVHFDNRQYPFILWEADKLDDLTAALKNRIEATIGRGPLE